MAMGKRKREQQPTMWIGVDATTLEANAALRSIVRRDSGESYEEFLTTFAKASGAGDCGARAARPLMSASTEPADELKVNRRDRLGVGCEYA